MQFNQLEIAQKMLRVSVDVHREFSLHPYRSSSVNVSWPFFFQEHLAEYFGDKFGESLGGGQAPPSFWKVPGLPRKFPELPRKFFGDFPGSSLTVEFNSNPEVPRKFPKLPRKFPKLPRKFPKLPRKFPDFPGGQPLSLGSLTPSPDSQKLSQNIWREVCGIFLSEPQTGHTRRGSYSRKGVFLPSKGLLESPFLEPLLRAVLRTHPPSKAH